MKVPNPPTLIQPCLLFFPKASQSLVSHCLQTVYVLHTWRQEEKEPEDSRFQSTFVVCCVAWAGLSLLSAEIPGGQYSSQSTVISNLSPQPQGPPPRSVFWFVYGFLHLRQKNPQLYPQNDSNTVLWNAASFHTYAFALARMAPH